MTPTQLATGRFGRRNLLRAGTGLAVVTAGTSCTFFDTDAANEDQDSSEKKGKEAPMLAARVEDGSLPPIGKRLPQDPMEVQPIDKVGVYGGTWDSAMLTQEDYPWLDNTIGYEPLVRWTRDWTGSPGTDEIAPNVAKRFEIRKGGQEYVFHLRRGLKWSDGEPCTAEDMRFTYEDYNIYEELHPDGLYELWTSISGRPAKCEVVDEYTVKFVFEEPKPGFLNELAANVDMVLPKHYLSKFHAKYNDQVAKEAKDASYATWNDYIAARADPWTNPEMPTLYPWIITNKLGDGSAVLAERNPYYWKLDPDGSQLLYIDRLVCNVLLDGEVEVLKIQNGDFDMQMRNFDTVRNKPVIAKNAEDNGYKLFEMSPIGPNTLIIGFNQTFGDEKQREVLANKDFRIGLSHAINRQRIIDSIYGGQGKPWQCAPLDTSPVYDKTLATQYLEYSPDQANEALDRAGYTERNGDGLRVRPDGEKLSVVVLVNSAMPDHVDALDLIRSDWEEVGVELVTQRVAETLYWERVEANQAQASTWTASDFEIRATQGSNHYYLPSNPRGSSRYGYSWALWYATDGAEGDVPPPDVKRQLELFDQMRETFDAKKAIQLGQEILKITTDRFYYIGISTPPDGYGIVRNNFHNVPSSMPGDVGFMAPGPFNPEQFYITGE